jgi:Flp pilus assembly protein TadG
MADVRKKRLWRGEKGAALVEMAVSTPVLLLMVLGIAKFGLAFNNYLVLTDSVETGARSLATSRGTVNPCQTAGTKLASAATTINTSTITMTATVNGAAYTASAGSLPSCSGAGTTMVAGDDAIMRATYPCNLRIYGITFGPSTCTLSSQTIVRVE